MKFCFFSQILQSPNQNFSSKRAVTIFAFLFMSIAFFANLFWDKSIEQFIYESMQFIVVAGLGFTTAEPVATSISKKINPDV